MSYSLRKRLLSLASFTLLLGFGLTAWIIDSAYSQGLIASIEDKLQVQLLMLLSVAEQNDGELVLPQNLPDPRFNQLSSDLFAVVLDEQGQEIWRSVSALTLSKIHLPSLMPGDRQFRQVVINEQARFSVSLGTVWEGSNGDVRYTFMVLEDSAAFIQGASVFRNTLWLLLGSVAVILLVLQWWLLHWGLKPLTRVTKELHAIELGENDKLNGLYPLELTPLTASINQLISCEQQQRQRYKDRMADLAHSLKTPLAILKTVQLPIEQPQLTGIHQQVARMTSIIEYQLQRAVIGGLPISFKTFAIAPVVRQIKNTLDKVYIDKKVHCQLELAPQALFRGDDSDLTEIIANLMDNAYKYGAGQVKVTVSFAHHQLIILVEDNGAGIEAQAFERVLTRGTRLDSQQQGQGIGLAMVNELVHQYHGEIGCFESSLLGAGIKISFCQAEPQKIIEK